MKTEDILLRKRPRSCLHVQAGQLYVLLFYTPEVLQGDAALMRVLVDKHYVDSWVVSWAPGASADLAWEWANYRVNCCRI